MSTVSKDPIKGGTQSYSSIVSNSEVVYILAYVDLPASDGIIIPTPTYKPAKNGNPAYLECEIDYPNEASETEVISYKIPLYVFDMDMGEFPDHLTIKRKNGSKKVKVKTAAPTGAGITLVQVNDIYTNILVNTPAQPEGTEAITFYFLFTQIANDGSPAGPLVSNPDLEANTLYYSFDGESTNASAEATADSYDYMADNQIVFTEVKLIDGSDVLSTYDLSQIPTPFPGFSENAVAS